MNNLSLKKRKICRCSWSKNALPWHANLRKLFSLSHTLAVKAQKFKRNLSPAVGPFPKGTGALSSIYRPPKLVIGSKSVLKTNQISLATGLVPSLVWIWVLYKHSMFPLLLRSSLFSTRDSSLSLLSNTHTGTQTHTHRFVIWWGSASKQHQHLTKNLSGVVKSAWRLRVQSCDWLTWSESFTRPSITGLECRSRRDRSYFQLADCDGGR